MAAAGVIEIDPSGDVILLCGTEEQVTKIQVSSHILSLGSAVFRSMLRPHFKEGQALATASTPLELPLPDDDADAMITVCKVLHHRPDDDGEPFSATEILEIAVLVDKYSCATAFKPHAQYWITEHLESTEPTPFRALLIASYFFQHAKLFERIGKELVLHSYGALWHPQDVARQHCPEIIEQLFSVLEMERRKALNSVAHAIEEPVAEQYDPDVMSSFNACLHGCNYLTIRTGDLVSQLMDQRLWPVAGFEHHQLQSLLQKMRTLELDGTRLELCRPKSNRNRCIGWNMPEYAVICANIHRRATEIEIGIEQACFECLQEGQLETGVCIHRFKLRMERRSFAEG